MENDCIVFGKRDQYRAFRDGRVQSRMSRGARGIIQDEWRDLTPKVCRTDRCGGYYYNVTAGITKGQSRIHVLICTLFNGARPAKGYEVDHIDGDRANNSASNLRWVTHKDNMKFAKERGAWKWISDNAFPFESEEQFLAIMTQINAGVEHTEMKRRYGLDASKFSRLRTMTKQTAFVERHKWLSKWIQPKDYFGGAEKFPFSKGA